jgi:hypothetical protein
LRVLSTTIAHVAGFGHILGSVRANSCTGDAIPYIMGQSPPRLSLRLKEDRWNGHVLQTISK